MPGRRPTRLSGPARGALPWAVAAVASLVLAALVLRIWHADFHAPFAYVLDAIQNLMLIKTTLAHGWPLHEHLLGAPFGQDLYDFPVVAGDVTHLLIINAIGLFSNDPAFVLNVFYLVQFPLTAVAALWALRRLGIPTWPAVVCAVLYACAPYHFYRGEIHVFLAGYWGIPLGMYLVIRLLSGLPLAGRGPRADPTRPLGWPGLVLVGVLVGASEVYYASFTLILLGVALLLALFRPNRRELVQTGGVALALIAVTVVAAHAPTILYHRSHGQNKEYAKARRPDQSEEFGMKVVRLVLPVDGHRIAPLASLTRRYVRESPSQLSEEGPQALGTLPTLGFLALIVVALLAIVPGPRVRPPPLLRPAASVALLATLIGTSGGFGLVASYFISDTLRSWNRLSVVIAFAALIPIGLALSAARAWMARRRLGMAAWAALLSAVAVAGVVDQTSNSLIPPYKQLTAQWQNEVRFTHAVERRMPRGAEIYEAPYYPFPEWGYELARGFLHSSTLHWSFGAMIGRPADWAHALIGEPGDVVLPSVAAAGFDGLYVDRALYPDAGAAADGDIRKVLGLPLVLSGDRRFELYDLRGYAARVKAALGPGASARLAVATLHPPQAQFDSSFGAEVPANGPFAAGNARTSTRPTGSLDLVNPSPFPRRVRLQANFNSAEGFSTNLVIRLPSGQVLVRALGGAGADVNLVLTLAPGSNTIRLAADISVDPDRKTYLVVSNFKLMDEDARLLALRASAAVRPA